MIWFYVAANYFNRFMIYQNISSNNTGKSYAWASYQKISFNRNYLNKYFKNFSVRFELWPARYLFVNFFLTKLLFLASKQYKWMYRSDVCWDNYRFIWGSENNFPCITSSVCYKLIVDSYTGARKKQSLSLLLSSWNSKDFFLSNDSCQQSLVIHSRHIPWGQTQTVTIDNKL